MIVAGSVFALSCVGIVALLGIKRIEIAKGRILVMSSRRSRLDEYALRLKAAVFAFVREAEQFPARSVVYARRSVRLAALGAARTAESLQEKAYALADRFSHKHRFERRETNSDFLRSVGEHPMRMRAPADERPEVVSDAV